MRRDSTRAFVTPSWKQHVFLEVQPQTQVSQVRLLHQQPKSALASLKWGACHWKMEGGFWTEFCNIFYSSQNPRRNIWQKLPHCQNTLKGESILQSHLLNRSGRCPKTACWQETGKLNEKCLWAETGKKPHDRPSLPKTPEVVGLPEQLLRGIERKGLMARYYFPYPQRCSPWKTQMPFQSQTKDTEIVCIIPEIILNAFWPISSEFFVLAVFFSLVGYSTLTQRTNSITNDHRQIASEDKEAGDVICRHNFITMINGISMCLHIIPHQCSPNQTIYSIKP